MRDDDWLTIAYDVRSGKQVWFDRYDGAAHLDEFNRWYDAVHIPDCLTSHGYRSVWRLELVAPHPGRAASSPTPSCSAARCG